MFFFKLVLRMYSAAIEVSNRHEQPQQKSWVNVM